MKRGQKVTSNALFQKEFGYKITGVIKSLRKIDRAESLISFIDHGQEFSDIFFKKSGEYRD